MVLRCVQKDPKKQKLHLHSLKAHKGKEKNKKKTKKNQQQMEFCEPITTDPQERRDLIRLATSPPSSPKLTFLQQASMIAMMERTSSSIALTPPSPSRLSPHLSYSVYQPAMPTLALDGAAAAGRSGGISGGGGSGGGGSDGIPSFRLDDGVDEEEERRSSSSSSSSRTSTRTLTSGIIAENTFEFFLLAPSGKKIIMFGRNNETVIVRSKKF